MEKLLKKIKDVYQKIGYGSIGDKLEVFIHNDNDYVAHYWGIEGTGSTLNEAIENLEREIEEYIDERSA